MKITGMHRRITHQVMRSFDYLIRMSLRTNTVIAKTGGDIMKQNLACFQLGIRACCDEGKRCAETLLMDSYRQHRTPDEARFL